MFSALISNMDNSHLFYVPYLCCESCILSIGSNFSYYEEFNHVSYTIRCFSLLIFLDVEDGHTLHLVVRQPGQSALSGNAGSEGLYCKFVWLC